MVSGARDLLEEHQRLGQAWLAGEQQRVSILQKMLKDCAGKCTMDYPDGAFSEYQEALARAAAANREYVQWLAQQGIQSR
jgi:hypothetical protein